jgi:hypothetical protein
MSFVLGTTAALSVAFVASAQTKITTGPSSSSDPYVRGTTNSPVTEVVSIITTGDTVNGYAFGGIPDGIGAFMSSTPGVMKCFVNFEYTSSMASGIRAHQVGTGVSNGAYIGGFSINITPGTDFLRVTSASDTITSVQVTNNGTGGSIYKFNRFCSGDIAPASAWFNSATGNGTDARFYITGDENGAGGRITATDVDTGICYEVTGLTSAGGGWENGLARPYASDTTLMMCTSDGGANRVFMWVGTKQSTGTVLQKAGLASGNFYGIQVQVKGVNVSTENRLSCFNSTGVEANARYSGTFTLAAANTQAGTSFLRPEDGAWDPANPTDFYFVTTDQMNLGTSTGRSRLWRMRFSDVNNPLAGGTIEALLTGTQGQQMFDNLAVFNTIQGGTNILIQEDPGNNAQNAKTWLYKVSTGALSQVLKGDTARFGDIGVSPTAPFTQDEENSGVIDARATLGLGWFLADMQAHYSVAAPLVEGGQLYAFRCPECVGSSRADLSSPLDGVVSGEDLGILLANWGQPGVSDINQDGTTDGNDIAILLANWNS